MAPVPVATIATIMGFVIDGALGGIKLAEAFSKFREGRDPNETPDQAAAEFAKEMLAQVTGEQEADDALKEWLDAHGP